MTESNKIEKKVVNNYGSFDVVFTHGEGSTLTDNTGRRYIDFIAGIGVNCLGHGHKALVEAITDQVKKEIHVSNYYLTDVGLKFADALLAATGFEGAYFCNSGAEANEAAIKLARKYGEVTGGSTKRTIVTLRDSFHGRTLATLTATGQNKFHPDCFAPYVDGFKITPGDSDFGKVFNKDTAAFLVECVQGEGGVNVLDKVWLRDACQAAHANGALVMVDEVQTGMGRSGTLLSCEQFETDCDVVTLAKGIAGGIPMGACIFRKRAAGVFKAGDHQSTFGGNPLVCRAGLVVLEELTKKGFLQSVKEKGLYITNEIKKWNSPLVKGVKGLGLLIGVIIDQRVKPFDIEKRALEKGLCTTTAGQDVIRFLPPLVITQKEIDEGLAIFKETLKEFE